MAVINLKVENLTPGIILDDRDPVVQDFIRDVYRNSKVHMPGMFHKVRAVRSIKRGHSTVQITMETYAVVTRPKGFVMGVL